LDVGFIVYVYMMGVCSCISGSHSHGVTNSWEPTNEPISWLKVLLDSRL